MNNTKEFLKGIGIDDIDSNYISNKTFNDGGQFRFEVPGIQSPKTMEGLLNEANRQDLVIHRVTQTKGIMLLTDDEIKQMVNFAKDYWCELFLSVGPRATYDTSATVHTKEGSRIGYRLRGYDNLVYAIEDVKRAVDLGVRGILLYDEGLLYVLNEMRNECTLCMVNDIYLYAFCGFLLHQTFNCTIEKCNLRKKVRHWEYINFNMNNNMQFLPSFFCASYYKNGEIILVGGNDSVEEKNKSYDT